MVSYENLVKTIYRELELEYPASGDPFEIDEGLHLGLIEQYRNHRTVVLIIDEAQNLPPETLERLRMLSNLETDKEKLIQIILIGQEPELDNLLDLVQLRQIKQRIAVRARIVPLTEKSSREYIFHRLKRAGCDRRIPFTEQALRKIIRHAKGIPRVINILCDNALITGYGYRRKRITPGIVREVIRDLRGMPRRSFWRWATISLAVLVCLAAFLAAFPNLRTYLPAAVNALLNSNRNPLPPVTQQATPSTPLKTDPPPSTAKPVEPEPSRALPSRVRHEKPVPSTLPPESVSKPSPGNAAAPSEKRWSSASIPEPSLAPSQPRAPTDSINTLNTNVPEKPLLPKSMPTVSAMEPRPIPPPVPRDQPSPAPKEPAETRLLSRQTSPNPAVQTPSASVQQATHPIAEQTPPPDPSDLIDWVIDQRTKTRRVGN